MKVKLMPMLTAALVLAFAFAPLAAQACTEKNGRSDTNTTQTNSGQRRSS
jgi:hypothetical protein